MSSLPQYPQLHETHFPLPALLPLNIVSLPAPGTFPLKQCGVCGAEIKQDSVFAIVGDSYECVECIPYEEDTMHNDFFEHDEFERATGYTVPAWGDE